MEVHAKPMIVLSWLAAWTALSVAGFAAEPTAASSSLSANKATEAAKPLNEETPVGPYRQPEWTTERRFATTRVYLQQTPWSVGVEQWVKA